jgi:uncharacterized membrane protein
VLQTAHASTHSARTDYNTSQRVFSSRIDLVFSDSRQNLEQQRFFFICIAVAGVYGTFTARKRIFLVQTLPASLAILFVYLSK